MSSQGRTYKLTELPVRSLGCTITQNTNTSASWTLFITKNGYPHSPYTCIRLQKTCSPHLRQSSQKQHENAEECSPSARPSPTVPKASPRASYACCMMRGVQLLLAGCSALRIGRCPRPAVTTFVVATTTNLLTGAKACRLWTSSSLIHTHKHQHLLLLCLQPYLLWPSNLQTPTPSARAPSAWTTGPCTLLEIEGCAALAWPHNARKTTLPAFLVEWSWTPLIACGPSSTTWVAKSILDECCQPLMSRVELWPASNICDKTFLYTGLRPLGGDFSSVPSVHVGVHSDWIETVPTIFVFYFTPSTPIFDNTSHPPPHRPNSFTFKRVQTPLTRSPSRVQTQITNSLPRGQTWFARQGFWCSGPRAFSHPGFCGLILHIVYYPILGLYLTPSRIFGLTLHIFSDTTRPSICT